MTSFTSPDPASPIISETSPSLHTSTASTATSLLPKHLVPVPSRTSTQKTGRVGLYEDDQHSCT